MVGLAERPPVAALQYPEQEFVIVGFVAEGHVSNPLASAAFVDAWGYHTPLYKSFRAREQVAELPESDFEPDDIA